MAKITGNFKFRLRFVGAVFFVLGGLLAGRLFFIQIVEHDAYSAKAKRQYTFYKSKPAISIRGDIYFKEKNNNLISAATIKEGFLAAVNPNIVEDPKDVCSAAQKSISGEFDEEDCFERASKRGDPFEIIAHRLDLKEAEKIQSLNIGGLDAFPEQWRFYPGGSLASQILGFVGYKGDELVGRYGLERYYEDVLKGEKESLKKGNSFAMLFFELGKEILSTDVSGGHDIVLTIEPRVQSLLEDKLTELIKKWGAKSAGGIVINPQTGAITAMASKPDFNPNFYNKVDNLSYFRNPIVASIFEFGSVIKPLTLAGAIDAGKINSKTTYVDKGYVVLNNSRIENYDGKARGKVDMQAVLNKSLNTGAIFVMQQLGKADFLKYMKNYGLDEKTGVDLPDEINGRLTNLLSGRDIEYATASFGQGIAMTPIEFSVAMSSLANGGVIVKPYVVEKILIAGGKDNTAETVINRSVLKEETSRQITRMLVNVVDKALLNGSVKLNHYSVAAKTGTAQIPKEDEAGYYEDQYLHSFFGYAPAFDAEFLIFLYLEKPQGVRYASHTLTYPFMELIKFLLNYYEVPPDR
jgi:cell division protein FtsI/penicillin-binding protein 2